MERAARLSVGIAVLVAAIGASGSSPARATARGGVLTGTWSGVLSGTVAGMTRHERIRIVVDARETGGSWRVSASCHGTLTLDSISNGYHHYRRRLAAGSTCAGGDVDCLEREGPNVADWVTPRPNGWARNGTLRRVRSG